MYKVEAESIVKDYESASLTLDDFIHRLEFVLVEREGNTVEFDLKGCHPSLANALRRILISQVPSMAIHHVSIYENSTVFPDEYIAHRLGLVPLITDADSFDFLQDDDEAYNNVLNFKLCRTNDTGSVISLTSDDIEFCPIEGQESVAIAFKPNVLICKLAPGNEVDIAMKAVKGRGEQHAKWSPVSLCTYRIMPRIVLERDFWGEDAIELQRCFSPGVIEIKDGKAVVSNPRLDSMSREVLRHEKFKHSVKVLRESGWFCFAVETIGEDPLSLVKKAIRILMELCQSLKGEVKQLNEKHGDD